MILGTLVRRHGGLISTSPVGIVIEYRKNKEDHWRKDRALVLWTKTSTKEWTSAYMLERVV